MVPLLDESPVMSLNKPDGAIQKETPTVPDWAPIQRSQAAAFSLISPRVTHAAGYNLPPHTPS